MELNKNLKELYMFFQIVNKLQAKSVLDAGMTMINNRAFSKQFLNMEIERDVNLDCLVYIDKQELLPIYKAVFRNIYSLDDDIDAHYDLVSLSRIFENIDSENIINFLTICLELGSMILYCLPKNNESLKEELGVFYTQSIKVSSDYEEDEYRMVSSIDIIKEIIILHVETNEFVYAKELLEKYKMIYKNSEVLALIEGYVNKGLGE
ncbi:hypothetical protein [Clostridium saccharoperbutylacetonicum]|uniref:hypothetical protein n=1 Tax=Clostridium saccharoperbutylacetonicum TaxID=36745 RepID=UPI0009839E85|nr:hypothetical protein [Clostridium saccharoperbutylacetonicum]AQR96976.1 hypothetical protein CLSAP_43000 [Clostridium saccharoperbutylacetonicum]NSB32855.1 hypothetical protein [Clostridium saccharoperbutylacetonicum]